MKKIITKVFNDMDMIIKHEMGEKANRMGTTVSMIYIDEDGLIYSANVGDSKIIHVRYNLGNDNDDEYEENNDDNINKNKEEVDEDDQDENDNKEKMKKLQQFRNYITKKLEVDSSDLSSNRNSYDIGNNNNNNNYEIVTQLSYEHKSFDGHEFRRVTDLGGFIGEDGRIMGIIAISRAIGDIELKKYIVSDPTISVTEIYKAKAYDVVLDTNDNDIHSNHVNEHENNKMNDDINVIVLACDGVWDVMSNQEVCDLVISNIRNSENQVIEMIRLSHIIRDCAFSLGSSDNISVCCINLNAL